LLITQEKEAIRFAGALKKAFEKKFCNNCEGKKGGDCSVSASNVASCLAGVVWANQKSSDKNDEFLEKVGKLFKELLKEEKC
jgi:hypothetical protein